MIEYTRKTCSGANIVDAPTQPEARVGRYAEIAHLRKGIVTHLRDNRAIIYYEINTDSETLASLTDADLVDLADGSPSHWGGAVLRTSATRAEISVYID